MSNAFDLTVEALRKSGLNSDQILDELSKLFRKMAETNNVSGETELIEMNATSLLKKLGVPIHVKGFEYWKKAIILYKKTTGKRSLEKIYNDVADDCDTTPSKVERAMRYSIEYAFKKCNPKDIEATFGSKVYMERNKITNKEFLFILAEQI